MPGSFLRRLFGSRPPEQREPDPMQALPRPAQERYARVLRTCHQIRSNYARLSSASQIYVQHTEEQFQSLLSGYARLLQASCQLQQYVQVASPDGIQEEIRRLETALAADSPKLREVNRQRIDVLKQRLANFEKIRENSRVVEAQCAAAEDVLALICDQSMTMRDPEEITERLSALVQGVRQDENAVRELEAWLASARPER